MRIVLFAFAVSLAVAQIPAPVPRQATDTGAPKGEKRKKETTTRQQPAVPVPLPAGSEGVTSRSSPDESGKNKPKDDPDTITITKFPAVSIDRDWIDFVTLGTGLALALIGIVGIIVAVRTLRDVEKQTNAMRAGVDALVGSERAWIVVRPTQSELMPVTDAIYPYNNLRHDIVNKGKTVAKIISMNSEFRILEPGETLPPEPIYQPLKTDHIGFANGYVLVPDDPINGVSITIDEIKRLDRIMKGEVMLYVYGYIDYFDFSGKQRRNQFCFRYFPSGPEDFDGRRFYWGADAPIAYSTHT